MNDLEIRQQLAKLTVVVLTVNRPGYLRGVIKYWSQWPVTLLILDGSDQPVEAASLRAGEARLILHSEIPISGRFRFAASQLDTPYACLHSDDDFTLARGAAQTISWMNDKPEISCVASDVFMFSEDRTGNLWHPGRTLTSRMPNERIAEHLAHYRFSYFYGIQRSNQLSIALDAVAAATGCQEFIEYPNIAAGYELGIEICGAALGQLSNWPDVLLLKRVGNETRGSAGQYAYEWLGDFEAQSAVRAWRSILSQHLAPHLDSSEAAVDRWLDEAFILYCQSSQQNNFVQQKSGDMVSKFARALMPKGEMFHNSRPSTRFVHRAHNVGFQALRGLFRKFMKILGKPRPSVSTLDVANPLDLLDVVSILDDNLDSKICEAHSEPS